MRAGIALGSNLGDRIAHLRSARGKILHLPDVREPFLFSAVYETDPVGCEPGAGKFLNALIEIGFDGKPERLLRELRTIEISLGRERDREQNASRTIDLDLLYFDDLVINRAELQVPHPRMGSRRFVLAPLADIRPDLILPMQTEPVHVLLTRLPDKPAVVRMAEQW
jgi:2-amino-4-hydroxy-6-hydroxymethyldihydropteridine diphosphokinase